MMAPVVDQLEKQYENIKFYKVDIELVPDVSSEYQVSAVPTFILFKDGQIAETVKGANPALLKRVLEQFK